MLLTFTSFHLVTQFKVTKVYPFRASLGEKDTKSKRFHSETKVPFNILRPICPTGAMKWFLEPDFGFEGLSFKP